MHARHYSPLTGRFPSVDPANESADSRLPQSWNRYAYVRGSPVNYNDPTGRFAVALASTFSSLCYVNGLCSNEILTVTSAAPSHNFLTGLQGLADLISGSNFMAGLGDFGESLGAFFRENFRVKSREEARADYERILQYDTLMECAEAGDCAIAMMPIGPGGFGGGLRAGLLGRKAGDMISGSLRRSPSYRGELADRTYQEILQMVRGKGPEAQAARQMKKLIENSQRLLEKTGGRPR